MKTLAILAILLLAFLGIFHLVYAQDVYLSTNQTQYYFKTGENAIVPIQINNTYGKPISGSLQYTITQQINQGNVQLSNTNSEEKSLSIDNKNSKVSLNLGKSDSPSDYSVNINYNYNVNGDRIVSLGPISVHFVSNGSNKNIHENAKMQSSSQPNNQPQTGPQDLFSQQQQQMQHQLNEMLGNDQDLFSQQQQQMQQQLNEMLGNPQNQSQNRQQQLQNNQLSQDSNALKHQLEKQVQKQEQVKNEFKRKLFSNNDFLNEHKKLLQNGYKIGNSDLNPVTNDTGSFNIKYNNTNGKWATLQGNMKNGILSQINQQTQTQQDKLLEQLKQNTQYQQFNSKLLQEGFSPNNTTFVPKTYQTDIILNYANDKNENASILAEFLNDSLKQVTLKGGNSSQYYLIPLLVLVAIMLSAVSIYLVIKKIYNKNKSLVDSSLTSKPKSSDYIIGSKKLMDEAVQHYDKGQYKEAFEIARKSLRFFLNGDADIKKEITNQELLQLIQNNIKYPLDDIRDCFKIVDLVQFAKSKPTESDFKKIISLFEKLVNKGNNESL
jgi:hypothetical protein